MKVFAVLTCVVLICAMVLSGCDTAPAPTATDGQGNAGTGGQVTLKVYNWGEYIAPDVLENFTKETGIKVEYDTFNDNESMYTKVRNSGSDSYDIVVPSDYMVKKMIADDMLAKINYDNIPNIENLDPTFAALSYDPDGEYSVPYLWGTVGILYNITKAEKELTSMRDLFDPAFSRQICMLDSMRDSIGMTLKMLGYSMNDTNVIHINEARDALIEQKQHVLAYGTDEIPPKIATGAASMALVFSGEGIRYAEEDPENLRFVIPSEGSNFAVDAFVILKTTKHQKEAEMFIDYMLDPEVAKANTEETGYSTTNAAAKELLDDDMKNDESRYPSPEVMARCEIFETIPSENRAYVDAWAMIKAK